MLINQQTYFLKKGLQDQISFIHQLFHVDASLKDTSLYNNLFKLNLQHNQEKSVKILIKQQKCINFFKGNPIL